MSTTMTSHPALASFTTRLVAFIVDSLLVTVILFVTIDIFLHKVLGLPDPAVLMQNALQRGDWVELLQVGMQYGSYEAAIEQLLPFILTVLLWVRFGLTPGKLLCTIRIIDARSGGKPGLGQAVLRYIGYIISTLTLGIGYLWMLWDKNNQALHDKIAGTLVVVDEDDLADYSLQQLEAAG